MALRNEHDKTAYGRGLSVNQVETPQCHRGLSNPWRLLKHFTQAFGARGYRAQTIAELNAVLKELKKITKQPTLVEVVIPEKDLPQQMYRLGIE